MSSVDVQIRDATPQDNAGLIDLAAVCPMEGNIGICVDRAPEFLTLSSLCGDPWRTLVAETASGQIAGCISIGVRKCHVLGQPKRVAFVGDLKVHPEHRGPGKKVADRLVADVHRVGTQLIGKDVLAFMTILSGNLPMEKRASGRGNRPILQRFGTMSAWSLPLLWRLRLRRFEDLEVRPAEESDIDEMIECRHRWGAGFQCSTTLTSESFCKWVDRAPGLDLENYKVARRADGSLAGFLGLWDQSSFKGLRVTSYTAGLQFVRRLYNHLGPLRAGAELPEAGGHLRCVSTVHLSTAPGDTKTLRALLVHSTHELRGDRFSVLNIGLDQGDPRRSALRGLFAQPTSVDAYVACSKGYYTGPTLADRPLQLELALV